MTTPPFVKRPLPPARLAPAESRSRYQVVVSLGESEEAGRLKQAFEAAAHRQGRSLSAWARSVLSASVGARDSVGVTREEHDQLEARVRRLELAGPP